MTLGLDENAELAMAWGWKPAPPWPVHQALPQRSVREDELFPAIPALTADPAEWPAFRAAFNRLAAVTPDLRLYRLIRIFNAPLASWSPKDAGHAHWAPWHGKMDPPLPVAGGEPRSHLWFFDARGENSAEEDMVVMEYTFDAGLKLRAEKKPLPYLKKRYEMICELVRIPRPVSPSRVRTLLP